MKGILSRKRKTKVLRILHNYHLNTGRSAISREAPEFHSFRNQKELDYILRILQAEGYVELTDYHSAGVHVVKLTNSGVAFFDRETEHKHSLWLQLRFNLLQTAIIAAASFVAGLFCEHWLLIINTLRTIAQAVIQALNV